MTLAQIWAILSILSAFGVDQPTINQVRDILTPPVATTTQATSYVPVVQGTVVENQPVYFGSTNPAPVIPTPPVQTPEVVVQSTPMIPLKVSSFQLYQLDDGQTYFETTTNKLLDFASTTISGAAKGEILRDGLQYQDEVGRPYHYEMKLSDVLPGNHTITITDKDGQTITRDRGI